VNPNPQPSFEERVGHHAVAVVGYRELHGPIEGEFEATLQSLPRAFMDENLWPKRNVLERQLS
jgi:hypothetical protein